MGEGGDPMCFRPDVLAHAHVRLGRAHLSMGDLSKAHAEIVTAKRLRGEEDRDMDEQERQLYNVSR